MRYYDLAKEAQQNYDYPIVLAKVGGQLHELLDTIKDRDQQIEFLTTNTKIGMRVYRRSLLFLFLTAVNKLDDFANVQVLFPLGDSLYIESDNFDLKKNIDSIEVIMRGMIERDIVITKQMIPISSAQRYFKETQMNAKQKLFEFRRTSSVTLYNLDGFRNYFYGDLVYSTGILDLFKLTPMNNGILLCYPSNDSPKEVKLPAQSKKMYKTLLDTSLWAKQQKTKTIGELNEIIVNGQMNRLILLQEAKMEKEIGVIADDIIRNNKKFVLIAGPSSSGKTSFSNRLSVQLQTYGINCHTIACDDYFKNKCDIPCDESGERNLESIEIVDLDQFDSDMYKVMQGERVEIPSFNFKKGEREYNGDHFIELKENDIVIVEGIHCLNPRFLPSVDPYRIYISALTPLNIDEHNRISSSDLRMLRRIARDVKHRGTSPQDTIKMWNKVRAGEEKNIFPYQENADLIFNSSLVYEVPMIKTIVEPLLFSVPKDSDEWVEAKRMLKFLDFFLSYSSDLVPKNSILQEFLGGSCFDVG